MKVIPAVVGELGVTPKKLKQRRLSDIGIETRIVEMQKTTLFSVNGGVK